MKAAVDTKFVMVAFLWALVMVGGFFKLSLFTGTPGELGKPPAYWPEIPGITLHPGRSTIIMAVHPRCPCSVASLAELAIVMGKFKRRVQAKVLFYAPKEMERDWAQTDLWASTKSIPGVEAIIDSDGTMAKLFNVATSGHTILYDSMGSLVFSGGITASRGHAGANTGRSAITEFLVGQDPRVHETFVYGCHLFSASS